jgi:cation diffusion facilitator family transporter
MPGHRRERGSGPVPLMHNEWAVKDCCEIITDVPARQRRVLQIVLYINAAMFLLECGAGLLAGSTALLADSVDMLGDALVYGFSLYVVRRGNVWQVRAALLKGTVMASFGLGVLLEAILKIARGIVPAAGLMGGIGLIALAANMACLFLLWRRRGDDINMRSAWLCSRNDVMANAGVLIAAGAVALTGSAWPDIAVGLLIAAMFVTSAIKVVGEARRALWPLTTP